jgi:hypothetical protein
MDKKQKRTLRLALVLGATVAGTAVIGYGGLAAWQAYTQNDGNTVAAGTVAHSNKVALTCTSVNSLPVSGCDVIFSVSGVSPTSPATLVSGAVKIDNTGSLNSTFALNSTAPGAGANQAPTGGLCADLVLTIKDANNATVFTGAMSGAVNVASLNNNAATPSATWTAGGTAGTGTGASGNTFTFTVTKGALFQNNNADQGTSCAGNFRFTQTNA